MTQPAAITEASMRNVSSRGFRISGSVVVACLAAGLALLAACHGKTQQASGPAAESANATAHASDMATGPGGAATLRVRPHTPPEIAADTRPVDTRITDVKLSDRGDGKVLTGIVTDQFDPSDGVFMSIRTRGTADTYTLSSRWLTPGGETLTEYSEVIRMPGPVETIFSLSKPDGWAKGQYRVELAINGKPMRTVSFAVR